MSALTDHDRRLLRKLSIRLEAVESAEALVSTMSEWWAERNVLHGTPLYIAGDALTKIAGDRIEGLSSADQAKALMREIWDAPPSDPLPPRPIEWTRDMEKKTCDRVQVLISDPRLTLVLQTFGPEVFRRSSIYHGLDEFLGATRTRGRTAFEVGTWNGLTAITLSRYFDRVITVDIVHNALKHRIIEYLGIDNIRCFDIADNDEKRRIAEEYDFDFAYLDGNHAHDTETDFALVERCGQVLFHEVWPFQRPVWNLVHRLPREEIVFGGDGLALWTAAK